MTCEELRENLPLYLYDEVSSEQRVAYEGHLAACASCRAARDEARRMHDLLQQRRGVESSPALLVECRQALDEALDREELGWRALVPGWLTGLHAIPASRALSALTILVFGFGLGWTLHSRPLGLRPGPQGFTSSTFTGNDAALDTLQIKDISRVAPDPQTGAVHITLDAERRMTLDGSLDDPRIRQVLVYAVRNYSNPGIRRDSLDALRAQSDSPYFRGALLYAMRNDTNAGVRLEALEDVEAMDWTPEVRHALLETLKNDNNPGVRVAAINALTKHADREALPVLQQLAAGDPSRYVRMKCANAIRELAENE